ncbi:MAG TPA: hypothetical protein VGF69_02105, partial [Thermoanaerobaculia bacterium]
MRKLTFLTLLILFLAAGAAIAQEIRFGQPPVGLAPGRRDGIVVAASRTQYLALWRDERISVNDPRLWASRVTASGIGVDGTGFNVTSLQPDADYDIASDGSSFFVAWTENHNRVRLVAISAGGEITPLTTMDVPAHNVALAWNGEHLFVAASRPAGVPFFEGGQIHVMMLDRAGNLVLKPTSLVESEFVLSHVEAIFVDGRFRLQWFDDKTGGVRSYGLRPAELLNGTATKFVFSGTAAAVRAQDVAFETVGGAGNTYYIARVAHRDGVNTVVGDYYTQNHQLLWTGSRLVNDESPNLPFVRPATSWNGTAFVTAWAAPAGGPGGLRVSFSKPALPAQSFHVLPGGEATSMAVTSVGTTTFVASTRDQPAGSWVEAELLSNDETSRTRFMLSAGLPEQALPTGVWRGNHHLLVWREVFGDGARLVTGRLSPGDAAVVRSASLPPMNVTSEPSIATDGSQALIAFNAGGQLQTILIDSDQNVLETKTLASAGTTAPTVIWDGARYVVTWGAPHGILAMRVGLDTQPAVLSPMTTNAAPLLFLDGDRYLFSWTDDTALRGLVVSRALIPQGQPLPLAPGRFSAPHGVQGNGEVAIATIDTGILHLVRWSLAGGIRVLSAAASARDIAGVLVDGDGYLVAAGAASYEVRGNAISKARITYPFVPSNMPATVLGGAPKTLVVWKRPPQSATEQRMQMVARYAEESPRRRVV